MALKSRRHNPAPEEQLDEHGQADTSLRQGEVSEADLEHEVKTRVARRMGWVSKEEWKRDPEKHWDVDAFLEKTPAELEALKESRKRSAQAAAQAIEDARRQGFEEARADLSKAIEAQDAEAAKTAADKMARHAAPAAETQAWLDRNPWYRTDPIARAVAFTANEEAAKAGKSLGEQLQAAEAAVRQRFPEHFGEVTREEKPPQEARLSEVRNPPMVSGGSRPQVTPREKGFSDIPAADRAQYDKHLARRFENMGLKPEEARARYARSYWANQE